MHFLGIESYKDILHPQQIDIIATYKEENNPTDEELETWKGQVLKTTYHLTKTEFNSFFLTDWNKRNNVGTVTELGRLLLTGWYYNIKDWAKNVGGYIYRAYQRKEKTGEVFNDLLFAKAVKHIRENIAVYYHREEELRLYIIRKFFNNELQPLLPEKPEELKSLDKALEFIDTQHKNRLKKDKDWYVKHYNNLEEYVAYLQELLETANITDYLTEKEFTEGQKRESRAYWEKIETLEKNYNERIRGKTLKLIDKLLPGE